MSSESNPHDIHSIPSALPSEPNTQTRLARPHSAHPQEIGPHSPPHRHSIIILHGRGSSGDKFLELLLSTAIPPTGQTLTTVFPHARFIFPTAARTRATIYKRSYIHQWFDNWHLTHPDQRTELMIDGLRQSVSHIHCLLQKEIELVGAGNVVLWGLSQGCATSLVSALCWDESPFAGVVGMCGWLPFERAMKEILKDEDEDGDEYEVLFGDEVDEEVDPLEPVPEREDEDVDNVMEAVTFLREMLDMSVKKGVAFKNMPVFLGHGMNDATVAIKLGREARDCLGALEVDVKMVEYKGLGHWYSEEMLGDIVDFVKEKLKIADEGGMNS